MDLQQKIAGLCAEAKTASYALALAKESVRNILINQIKP